MIHKDLETAFCGVIANKESRTITYLVEQNYDEVLDLLRTTGKHLYFYDLESKEFPTGVNITVGDEEYLCRFPNNADFNFINEWYAPYHIRVGLKEDNEISRSNLIWTIQTGVQIRK